MLLLILFININYFYITADDWKLKTLVEIFHMTFHIKISKFFHFCTIFLWTEILGLFIYAYFSFVKKFRNPSNRFENFSCTIIRGNYRHSSIHHARLPIVTMTSCLLWGVLLTMTSLSFSISDQYVWSPFIATLVTWFKCFATIKFIFTSG